MNRKSLLERKHALLKSELDKKLQNKRALELEITKRFDELKRLEISMIERSEITFIDKAEEPPCYAASD